MKSRVFRYGLAVRNSCWVLVLGILATCSVATAQTNTASLTGVVTDASGAVIPKATVLATSVATGLSQQQDTDSAGRYTMTNLAPGFYTVNATAQGFTKVVRPNQELLVGTTSNLDFTLAVSSTSQTVEVTTEVPQVDVSQDVLSRVIQTNELDTMPIINRSFAALAQLSPGVQVNAAGTSVQFGDSGTYSNAFIVDGNSIVRDNYVNTSQIVNLAQDWIQEFSVVTEQAPAEYGLSSSGFINAITRSGSNNIHGRAYGYFQDAALNATPAFLPKSAPNKPAYDQQRLGGFLGGPIQKDKLFYFIGYERLHTLTSVPVNVPVAFISAVSGAGVYQQPFIEHIAMVKFDYQLNHAHSLHLRVNEDYTTAANQGIGASGTSVNTLGYGTSLHSNGTVYQLTWDYVITPKVLNEVRAGYYKDYQYTGCNYAAILGPYKGGGANATPYGDPTGYYATVNYPGAALNVGCTSLWGGLGETNWTIEDDLSITEGSHQIKVGVGGGNHILYNTSTHRLSDGTYSMPGGLQAPFSPMYSSTFPISYSVTWQSGDVISGDHLPTPNILFFAQDSWKVKPSLTLNLGLRYDFNTENSNITTLPILNKINNDPTNLAPRLGFAWTPFRDDKRTVIRGGFGVYYDLQRGDTAATYLDDDILPQFNYSFSATSAQLNPYCFGNNLCNNGVPQNYQNAVEAVLAYSLANYTFPNFNPPGGQITLAGNTYTIPALTVTPPTSLFNYEPNLKNPGTMQTTIGVARQFRNGISGTADYVYTYGFNQYNYYNANLSPITFQPIYAQYTAISTYGSEDYYKQYSLRAQGTYTSHRGDSVHGVYTLTYGNDNDPTSTFGLYTTQYATDPFNLNVDYGPLSIAHNIFTLSGDAKLPYGIIIAPIFNYTGPLAFTPTTTQRGLPGCPAYYFKCYPTGYGKNSVRGISNYSLNSRVSKTFRIKERYSAMLMFEGYNITNHLNPTTFQASVQAANFKAPLGASATRQLQAGFEFDF